MSGQKFPDLQTAPMRSVIVAASSLHILFLVNFCAVNTLLCEFLQTEIRNISDEGRKQKEWGTSGDGEQQGTSLAFASVGSSGWPF